MYAYVGVHGNRIAGLAVVRFAIESPDLCSPPGKPRGMQQNGANYDDVVPDFPPAPSEEGTGQGAPPNGGRGRKLPLGCLIAAGIVVSLWPLALFPFLLGRSSRQNPGPTPDYAAIETSAFESALASNVSTIQANSPTPKASSTAAPLPTATHTAIPTLVSFAGISGASCIPSNPPQTGKVVEVVDGDTIKVLLDEDGKVHSLRYVGIDSPERGVAYSAEATAKNAELVYGKEATLVRDVSETDMYGRLLRYVVVDGIFVNFELVADGSAKSYRYPPDTACNPTFEAAQSRASAAALGVWALPPALIALPTAPRSGGTAACNCNGPDLDCKDFGSHASAQACYSYCSSMGFGDVFRLDGDADGNACESLP